MAYPSRDNSLPNGPTLNRKTGHRHSDMMGGDQQEALSQILTEVQQSHRTMLGFKNEMSQLREGFENKFSQLYELVCQLALKSGIAAPEIHSTPPVQHAEFSTLESKTALKGAVNLDSGNYSGPNSLLSVEGDNSLVGQENKDQSLSSIHSYSELQSQRSNSHEQPEAFSEQNGQIIEDINEEYNDTTSQTTFKHRLDSHVNNFSEELRPQMGAPSSPLTKMSPDSEEEAVGGEIIDVVKSKLLVNGRGYKRRLTTEAADNRMTYLPQSLGNTLELEEMQERSREEELLLETSPVKSSFEARVKPIIREPAKPFTEEPDLEETAVKPPFTEQTTPQGIVGNSSERTSEPEGESDEGPVPLEKQHLEELTLKEAQRAAECTDPKSDGADTIICIDTSDSMIGEGIRQAKLFISDFLDGIEECAVDHALEENIAIVTFGRTTRVVQHLTNDYSKIKDIVDELEMGGPSPMMTGLVLCISAIYIRGGVVSFKNRKIMPRIVLISDGQVTDPRIMEGPDRSNSKGMSDEEARKQLIEFSERLKNERRKVTCVPVGKADQNVMKRLSEITGGGIVELQGARKLSQQFLMNTIIARILSEENITPANPDRLTIERAVKEQPTAKSLSESEISDVVAMVIEELKSNPNATVSTGGPNGEQGVLPPIGTRVRRGPDWIWEDQDDNMAGTITSHRQRGMVGVEWDSGRKGKFRFGSEGSHDLRIVDEPRYLQEGEIAAVGVKCFRGPDWEWDNQDGGEGSIGTVFKIEDNGIIHVRWENGKRGNYRFGLHNKYDIMMNSGSDGFPGMSASGRSTTQTERLQETVKKRPQWQWKDSNGVWQDHLAEASNKIEELYKKRQRGTTLVKCNGASCRVVIQNLQQRNTSTGQETQIRRIEVPSV